MRKFLSILLVMSTLLSLVVVNVTASTTETKNVTGEEKTYSVWGGYKEYNDTGVSDISNHLAGSGTPDDPYLIQSAADLAFLAYDINNTKEGQILQKNTDRYTNMYIVQTVDIDLANNEWIPIGTDCDYGTFCGVYDGRGHEIINMRIDKVHGLSHGLFGYLGDSGGQVDLKKNQSCGITNLYLHGEITAANNRVGGLVGQIHNRGHVTEGTEAYITNVTCEVTIDINGTTGGKGNNTGSDVDNKYYFGGVAGISNFAVFENVVNKGNVNVVNCNSSHPIGGIIGRATRTILKDCINEGGVKLETNCLNIDWVPGADETVNYDQNLSGTLRAGGVVGQYIKMDAEDYLIFKNCINNGNVTATEEGSGERVHAGGILGSVTYLATPASPQDYDLTFENCANTGEIKANRTEGTTAAGQGETNAGGILATTYHGVGSESTNAGGIEFTNCANTGTVDAYPNNCEGGITGMVHVLNTTMTFTNCHTSGTPAVTFSDAKINSDKKNAILSECTTSSGEAENMAEAYEGDCMISLFEICGFPTWGMTGLGTADVPYRISNFKELKVLAALVNSATNVNSTDDNRKRRFENVYITQTANIPITGEWTPIGKDPACSFLGVYDGKDHTISGMNITKAQEGATAYGLFGYIGKEDPNTTLNYDCGIANLIVEGSIKQGAQYIGGIVGKINHESYVDDGQIAYVINTTSKVNISIGDYSSDADINWGGVVGYAASTIFERVENNGEVIVSGDINCGAAIGGIAGRAEHVDMFSCKNTKAVSFKTTNTKANGAVYVGGLVGLIRKTVLGQEQRFAECINSGDVSGTRYTDNWLFVGGIVGGPDWDRNALPDSNRPFFKYEDDNGNEVVTGVRYRDYNIRFSVCTNSGAISATISSDTDNNSANMNSAGILGSTYVPSSRDQNNGGIRFEKCANTAANITSNNPTRAAGITQAIYVTDKVQYDFGLLIEGCATYDGTDKNDSSGNRIFVSNSYDGYGKEASFNPYKQNLNFPKGSANVILINDQAAYACGRWSGYNINEFPTGKTNDEDAGSYVSAFLQGVGTKNDPFVIRSAADLRYFRNLSNTGNGKTFKGNYIIQTADIDLGGENWTPIARSSLNSFLGVYDGKGHTIKGLSITNANGNASLGLFGYIGPCDSGIVLDRDCGVANLTVIGSITEGRDRVGGLAGQIGRRGYGVAKNSNSYKTYITNVTCNVNIDVSDYMATGNSIEGRHYFGGVVGFVHGAVFENVVNEGSVELTDCYADHPAGGIAGRAATTEFISCTNKGVVKVSTDDVTTTIYDDTTYYGIVRAGGIVGLYFKAPNTLNGGEWISFVNCVNEGEVTAEHKSADAVSGNRVHAGGILASLRYPVATDKLPTYGTTGCMYSPYDISFENCINKAPVSATNEGAGETNAGGIVGTLYDGLGGIKKNAGDITAKECVNLGAINSNSKKTDERAAGIVCCVYNEGKCDYGVKIIGCMTGAELGGVNSSKIAITASNETVFYEADNKESSDLCNTLEVWNRSLMAHSLKNINGMPTAANFAVIRGLENGEVDLNEKVQQVSDTIVILNEAGERVNVIDKPGKYQYVLAFHGAQVRIKDTLELYYQITCDANFVKTAGINVAIQDDVWSKKDDILNGTHTALNTYTEYGKTGAYRTQFLVERVLPQQFAEPIYTTFTYGGHEVYKHEYALAIYARNIISKTHNELNKDLGVNEWTAEKKAALNVLLVDLFRYAEEAQKLKWMKGPYATYYIPDGYKALGNTVDKENLDNHECLSLTYDEAYEDKYLPSNEIFVWRGAKLSFDHNIIMRIELSKKPADLEGYEIQVQIVRKDSKGNVVKTYTPSAYGFNEDYVYVEGFSPLNYDCEVVIDIIDKQTKEKAAATVHYSINTYIYRRWSASEAPLVQALANYAKSVRVYCDAMGYN